MMFIARIEKNHIISIPPYISEQEGIETGEWVEIEVKKLRTG